MTLLNKILIKLFKWTSIALRNYAKAELANGNKDSRISSTILPRALINSASEVPTDHPLHPFVYDRLREIARVINGRILFVPIIVRR